MENDFLCHFWGLRFGASRSFSVEGFWGAFFEAKLPPKLYQLVGPLIHGEAQIKTSSNLWFLVGILLCTK